MYASTSGVGIAGALGAAGGADVTVDDIDVVADVVAVDVDDDIAGVVLIAGSPRGTSLGGVGGGARVDDGGSVATAGTPRTSRGGGGWCAVNTDVGAPTETTP